MFVLPQGHSGHCGDSSRETRVRQEAGLDRGSAVIQAGEGASASRGEKPIQVTH